MAIKLVKKSHSACAGEFVKEFVVDSDDDFANLPRCCPGSTALSPSGTIMIVNASGQWVAFGG